MKKLFCILLTPIFILTPLLPCDAETSDIAVNSYTELRQCINNGEEYIKNLNLTSQSAVLMEAETGTVLLSQNCDEKLPPASVTKVMTLLLICEALDNGQYAKTDTVTASEHAASMGGTQIYLEVGEEMTVDDLVKAIAVPSANDAAAAMAEFTAGSEEAFVQMMNDRAAQLGMTNTHFTNCSGLFDDTAHYTTAKDIAIMTGELLKHKRIFDYTTIWMDTLRNGTFGLANTNKMLRTYQGMNGMKTGYTKLAKYCFSGTAERNGMQLIAVVMGAPSSNDRFDDTAKMLDYGFANFEVYNAETDIPSQIRVLKGKTDTVSIEQPEGLTMLVAKGQKGSIKQSVNITESITAPAEAGLQVGTVTYTMGDETLKVCPVVTTEKSERASFGNYFIALLGIVTGL